MAAQKQELLKELWWGGKPGTMSVQTEARVWAATIAGCKMLITRTTTFFSGMGYQSGQLILMSLREN